MLKPKFSQKGDAKNDCEDIKYPSNFDAIDNLSEKIDYLKIVESEESDRNKTIESKTSTLIGQTSIIFSIVSLFITNYISAFSMWNWEIQLLLILIFSIVLFCYLRTIFIATKYFQINKNKYGRRSHLTVLKKFKTSNELSSTDKCNF